MTDLSVWEIKKIKWKKGGQGEEIIEYVASPSFEKVIESLGKGDPLIEIISVAKIVNINAVL